MFKLFRKKRSSKAFSFIGLIITITIIGLLVVVVVFWQQSGRAKSRDLKRVAELNSLRTALQLYYMDYGGYPEHDSDWCSLERDCGRDIVGAIEPYLGGEEMPRDPLYPSPDFSYQYTTLFGGKDYKIYALLESGGGYEVYSGGGKIVRSPEEEPEGTYPPTVVNVHGGSSPSQINRQRLRGYLVNHGSSDKTTARGFEWTCISCQYTGDSRDEWVEYNSEEGFETGPYEFDVDMHGTPGMCQPKKWRSKAYDPEGGWGYGTDLEIQVCTQ